jgi:hypothetical protein
MTTMITTKDGTQIYFKDWGPRDAQPIVFHHGWPRSADDWDPQMMFFLDHKFRVIAHDRRGHGRSTQTWTGNEMDTYAADVAALTDALDLKGAIHVGHSTGGGEVAHYVAREVGPRRQGCADRGGTPDHGEVGKKIRAACRSRFSMGSATSLLPTARSSSSTFQWDHSMASIGRAQRSTRGSSGTGGARA